MRDRSLKGFQEKPKKKTQKKFDLFDLFACCLFCTFKFLTEIRAVLASNEDQLPSYKNDLLGATASIFRLQDTYGITAREISDGRIKGKILDGRLSKPLTLFYLFDIINIFKHIFSVFCVKSC